MESKKQIKVLVVEDENSQIQIYQDTVDEYNDDNNIHNIDISICRTLEEGIKSLYTPLFDAAIIDLKLSGSTEMEGMSIVEAINENLRIPIFIVSGSISQIDTINETALLKKRERTTDFNNVLKEIVQIYNTGITNILGNKGVVEKLLNNIFWKHIPLTLNSWLNDESRDSEQKEKSLLRYTLLHMQEYIDEDIEKYHPSEFYIAAPIKKIIHTGDIVCYEDARYIVLTPSCDMVIRSDGHRGATKILFCKIVDLKDVINNYDTLDTTTSENNTTRKRLNVLIENKKQNYHFIPKSNKIGAGLIDFQDKKTIEEEVVNNCLANKTMERIATVSMPFLKDIVSRYSNYYARQGSPDFDTNEIFKTLFKD